MDYTTIDAAMASKGLLNETAFRDVYIAIQPIPCMNGCPLGLYYPDEALIVLPPDGTKAALFHELGHRYGDYHYHDLSERFAEAFREKYQGTALLYMGSDFKRLPSFGKLFEEGQRGRLSVSFTQCPSCAALEKLQDQLSSYGEKPPRISMVEGQVPTLVMDFTKGVDWVMIAAAGLGAMAVAGIGAMGYAIYKTAKDSPWVLPLVMFGAVAGTVLVAGWAGRRYVRARA